MHIATFPTALERNFGRGDALLSQAHEIGHSFKPTAPGMVNHAFMKPLNLLEDAVHLFGAESKMAAVLDFNHDYDRYLAEFCTQGDPGRLMSLYETNEAWTAWESHPAGEELVLVIRGKGEFIQEIDGEERRIVVGPNQAIINPPGVWHTANVIEPFLALFITPGPGTKHRPR